jgi:uncharacterized glyoxalase superfamily protein PhnB
MDKERSHGKYRYHVTYRGSGQSQSVSVRHEDRAKALLWKLVRAGYVVRMDMEQLTEQWAKVKREVEK